MGYKEALFDGIRTEKRKDGTSVYFPLCHKCGAEVYSINYLPNKNYTCKACKSMMKSSSIYRKGLGRL